jgi:hypothetical protein
VPVLCIPLYWHLPNDGGLLLKRGGGFCIMYDLYYVYMLVYVNDFMRKFVLKDGEKNRKE